MESLQPAALEELYRRFAPLVHARTRRIVGRDADEVVRELFARLLDSDADEKKIASWIFSTSTTLAIDHLRDRARRDDTWEAKLRAAARRENDIEAVLARRDIDRLVLARLDRDTQEVVVLVRFEELTQEEAAVALNQPREAVEQRMRRFHEEARALVEQWRR